MTKPSSSPHAVRPVWAALLITVATLLAWSNSFTAPFVFDDHGSIGGNASIKHLLPVDWLRPPATGETVSGRPVLNFTFALNYAVGGLDVRGYHAVNLAIHVFAALTLFGIVRRTLLRRPLIPFGGESQATNFAAAVTLIWAIHPLQVESVTYIVQRAESLAGLFCLLTLYAFIRGLESGRGWRVIAIVACLLGVGTKETAVVMPAVVLLYDWIFAAGTWRGVWQERRWWHAALFLTWMPLGALVLGAGGDRGGAFAFTVSGFFSYWVAQLKAVTCYLGLVIWPSPLVFDRAFFRVESFMAVAPYALVIALLMGVTAWALRRRTPAGFLGAFFFIVLSPTSLMPGLLQVTVEHRMYLALAAPVILLAVAAWRWAPRHAPLLVGIAVVALGLTTFARNRVYQSNLTLWQDTVQKSPDNPRAHYNLGLALRADGREAEAVAEFEQTLALQSNHAFALFELGKGELLAGHWAKAVQYFDAAVQADFHFTAARVNLGQALAALGRADEAVVHYRQALADDPGAADIRINLGGLLIKQGRAGEGEALLREALAIDPTLTEARYHLGLARQQAGARTEAEAEFRAAVNMKSDAGAAEAWFALGNLLARQERIAEAASAFQSALTRVPTHALARASLANCQLMAGRVDEAIANYEAVLRVRPDDAGVRRNLDLAREMKRGR